MRDDHLPVAEAGVDGSARMPTGQMGLLAAEKGRVGRRLKLSVGLGEGAALTSGDIELRLELLRRVSKLRDCW